MGLKMKICMKIFNGIKLLTFDVRLKKLRLVPVPQAQQSVPVVLIGAEVLQEGVRPGVRCHRAVGRTSHVITEPL